MRLQEFCRLSGATRKAAAYYEEQGLLHPRRLENGYREFTPEDARRMERILLLRRLEVPVEAIRGILDGPDPAEALRACLAEQDAASRRLEVSRDCLRLMLQSGPDHPETEREIRRRLGREQPAALRLQAAFPGKYGDFIFLHFGWFLDTPVDTEEKAAAYAAILDFLDNLEELPFPPELEESLRTACEKLTEASLAQADAAMEAALAEPDRYLSENQEAIRNYLAYRSSPAFRRSPAGALRRQLLAFQQAVGYEGFLRNLERLSPAYRAYRQRIALADESFRRQFPEAAALFDEEQAALSAAGDEADG